MDGVQGAGEQPQTFTGCTGRSTGTRSIISRAVAGLGLPGKSQPPGEIVAVGSRAGAEGTTWRGGDMGRG